MPANSRWDLIRGLKGYDNVSDLDNTASIDWTTELSTAKCVEEGGRRLQLLSHVCLQILTKTIEILNADSRRLCRVPNLEPPERKSKAPTNLPGFNVLSQTVADLHTRSPPHLSRYGSCHTYLPYVILQFGPVLTPSAGVVTVSSTSAHLRSCVEVSLSLSGRGCRMEPKTHTSQYDSLYLS